VSFHFVAIFYQLPRQSFDDLVRCAISALSLQERYSLVTASTFLVRSYDIVMAGWTGSFLDPFCRPRWSKIPTRTTISQTQRTFSSTLMVEWSCALCSSVLLAFRRSQLSRISSSYSRSSSQKHRWRAKIGSWMSYMGFVSGYFELYLFSSGFILCCRVILSDLVRVQKPRTL
jgi:hypothetical protein